MKKSHYTILSQLIEDAVDIDRQLNWSKQLSEYLIKHRNKYPAIVENDILVVQPVPVQDIDLSEEAKYYYDPNLIGNKFNDYIVNFNLAVKDSDDLVLGNSIYREAHNVIFDILLAGMVSQNINNGELIGEIISAAEKEDLSVGSYIQKYGKNLNFDKVWNLNRATYMAMHLTSVILTNVFGINENKIWRKEDTSFLPTNLNILILQLFNRAMYYNFKSLQKFIKEEVLNGDTKPDITDVIFINLFKLWIMNTFDISEFVHKGDKSIDSPILYTKNNTLICTHDNSWNYETLTDKEMDKYLSEINEFIIHTSNAEEYNQFTSIN